MFTNIAGYQFSSLSRLPALKKKLEQRCKALDLKGTILISEEGINFFLAGLKTTTDLLLNDLKQLPGCAQLQVKESSSQYQPFRRMLVKIKKEIISLGIPSIHPASYTSRKISPHQLKEWLDKKRPLLLLDTRNDYEIRMGTFHGAHRAGITHFRSFAQAIKKLPPELKEQTVVTFCTGGIRCEKGAPLLEAEGFKNVFQLEGGILNYFKECGNAHYQGECFVFDQRVGVDANLQETSSILCFQCQMPLSATDQEHQHYVFNKSCPYCFGKEKKKKVPKTRRTRKLKKALRLTHHSLSVKSLITIFFLSFYFAQLLLGGSVSSKAYFLDTNTWRFSSILPSPANKDSQEQARDLNILKDAMAARTKKQLFRALIASSDTVFDYASVIDPRFTSKQLPYTADFFKKIDNDTNIAIHAAKEAFHRLRPATWDETSKEEGKHHGYAYPSGHSTRAFLWAGLLSDLFPEKKKEIEIEARTKAWNRVILGRHYPDDVYGGELYGQYLTKQFLENRLFQQDWVLVKEEVQKVLNAK